MPEPRLRFELLEKSHDLSSFSCRNEVFTSYLQECARQDMRRRAATVVLLMEARAKEILGYYTISSFGIALTDLPDEMRKRLPRYPVVPAVLIERLALDHRFEGKGFGQLLLIDALERAVNLDVAVWGAVVDAIDEAAVRFYERFGFIRLEDDPGRLVLPLETYLKARNRE
jgi:GNAT superfamily N-acetyltransferase